MGWKKLEKNNFFYDFETLIKKILDKKPELTKEKLMELIEKKRVEAKNLLNLEGAAFLVALDLGISIFEEGRLTTRMKINDLIPNLGDVTVSGRVLMFYPVQEFTKTDGSKGKLQRVLVGDESGMVEVFVWNEKVDEITKENIEVNSLVKIEHGYTRESIDGRVELHVGDRGKIYPLKPQLIEHEIPPYHEFFKKIGEMKKGMKDFNFSGIVVKTFPVKHFSRPAGEGKVQRLRVKDETGEVNLVVWDSLVEETEKIQVGDQIEVLRGTVKENMIGELEVHVGKRSKIKIVSKAEIPPETMMVKPIPINQIEPEKRGLIVEGTITGNFGVKEVTLKDGSKVKVAELLLTDETGEIKVSAWREHAEILSKFPVGIRIRLKNVSSKMGIGGNVELATISSTILEVLPPKKV